MACCISMPCNIPRLGKLCVCLCVCERESRQRHCRGCRFQRRHWQSSDLTHSFHLCQPLFTSNVVIGANSQAILLIFGKLIMGQKVVLMEGGGVMVAFLGCILCSSDEAKEPDNGAGGASMAVVGDLLALGSGAFGVGYLTFAKAVRKDMAVTVFMFFVMVVGSCLVLLFMAITEPEDLSFSRDPFFGLFGWMTVKEYRFYILVHIAIVCNIIGMMVRFCVQFVCRISARFGRAVSPLAGLMLPTNQILRAL